MLSINWSKAVCDLYYKHLMIVHDDSSVISKRSSKLIDDARVIIYDLNMFIIQAIDCSCVTFVLIFLKIMIERALY
jgi:hypothetical protein